MIAVKLMGGLGNQMFQYAAARSLALEKNTWVYLDPSFLYEDAKGQWTQRDYELGAFNVQYKFERSGRINFLRRLNHSRRWKTWSEKRWWPFSFRNFNETDSLFHPELFSLSRNAYLQGYFQSEKYFLKHAGQIRNDFEFIEPASGRNAETLEKIRNSNSISVHVRRGDYVTLRQANLFHGTLGVNYYNAAAALIAEKMTSPVSWFVFSDEPEWVKVNLQLPGEINFIDWNMGNQSFEDLRLMSNCKHHIIANSSFSWWGAWLNPSTDKKVITPARWFAERSKDDRDIIPGSWTRISEGPLA